MQFITRTIAGSRAASNTHKVEWTPPATDAGNVVLYVAGKAANGDGSSGRSAN